MLTFLAGGGDKQQSSQVTIAGSNSEEQLDVQREEMPDGTAYFPTVIIFKTFQAFKINIFNAIFSIHISIMYLTHRSKLSQQDFSNPLCNKTSSRY